MWLPGRNWFAGFTRPAVAELPADRFTVPLVAVGPDLAGRATVGPTRFTPWPAVTVRGGVLRPAVRAADPSFGPVAVRRYTAARFVGLFSPPPSAPPEVAPAAPAAPPPDPPALDPDELFNRELARHPVMSAEETRKLLLDIAGMGPVQRVPPPRRRLIPGADRPRFEELRNRLVCGHMLLCLQQINATQMTRRSGSLEWVDLVQEGMFGLSRAIELFDPGRGTEFSTYAFQWIRHALDRAIAAQARLIRIPNHQLHGPGRLPPDQISRLTNWLPLSRGEGRMVGDRPDPDSQEPIDELSDLEAHTRRPAVVAEVLATLAERDADIIRARFGLIDGYEQTLQEIGNRMGGLSKERIRQLERRGLDDLGQEPRRTRLESVAPS